MNHIRSFGNHNAVVFVRCHFRHCFLRTGTYSYWRWWLISTPLPSVTASHVFLKKLQCKMHEHYKPSKAKNTTDKMALRLVVYAGSDLNFSSAEWTANIVGKVSERIDLDSRDDHLRMDSETLLNQQIDWASYLSIEACLLPAPKGNSCANYARCVNQILPRLKNMKLWLRIPLGTSDDDYSPSSAASVDSWQTWNSFRLLCDHPSAVLVALDVKSALPSENSLKRWFGEPITVAILESDIFLTKARGNTKYLPKRHQKLVTDLFDHSLQVILSGTKAHSASGSQTQSPRQYEAHLGPYTFDFTPSGRYMASRHGMVGTTIVVIQKESENSYHMAIDSYGSHKIGEENGKGVYTVTKFNCKKYYDINQKVLIIGAGNR